MRQILSTIVISFLVLGSYAQDTVRLQELVVSSSANPVEFKEISRTVHIITKEEILNSPIQSLDELLKIHGGVDVRSRGAMGVQSDINLRGGTFDQGLIMLDGISVNDPQTGHHNLNQPIDMDDIEKIEIFEGPGARWFGANSFSGGINIISSKPKNKQLTLSLSGGQYGYFSGKMRVDYGIGEVKNKTSFGIARSDGYIRNTDFNTLSFDHNSIVFIKKSQLLLKFSMLDKGFGANGFYTPKYPDQYEHIRTYFTSASFETGTNVKFKSNVYWRRNLDRFELFREDKNWYQNEGGYYIMNSDTAGFPTSVGLYPYQGHNFHRTDIIGADASINFNTNAGSTSLSANLVSESIVSNVLGEPMIDTIWVSGFDGYYNKSKQRTNVTLALNQQYTLKRFSVSAGLSMFYNNDYGVNISPGIDLGYFISDNVKVFASANHAIRLPTFTDLYYQGPTNTSNPNLIPETSISTEAGIKYFNNSFNTSLSGFYRKGENIIDWIKYSPDEKWQSANLSSLNTYGIAVSANKQFSKGIIKHAGIKYTWLKSVKDNGNIISLYALDYLNHNLNIFIAHDMINKLTASWTVTVQNRNGSYIDYSTGKETPYSTIFLINAKLIYQYKDFDFSLSASNLLNRKYYDIGNIEQPGLWVIGGVRINIHGKK